MSKTDNVLKEYIGLVVEAREQPDVTLMNGAIVPFGSPKHLTDLQSRIHALQVWRDASVRGSEKRANYTRLINQYKAEMKSAQRYAER